PPFRLKGVNWAPAGCAGAARRGTGSAARSGPPRGRAGASAWSGPPSARRAAVRPRDDVEFTRWARPAATAGPEVGATMDGLLAANRPTILDERLLWATGALVGVLFGAAAVIHFLRRWRDRQVAGGPGPEADPLTAYREMYLRGELTKEEYQR